MTNEKISDAMGTDIGFIFLIVSYEVLRRKAEKKEMDKIRYSYKH